MPFETNELLFQPPGHFYSPIGDRTEMRQHFARLEAAMPRSVPGIRIDDGAMLALWNILVRAMSDCSFPEHASHTHRYHFENDMYSYGDALVYRSMLKHVRPERLIEIGSGYSSAVALDTRDEIGAPRSITFVEPYPDALHRMLRETDRARVRMLVDKVQNVALDVFAELCAGDVLFVDSSHVIKTGSDVQFIIWRIVPSLKPGVIVHFHDVFWPFEYPPGWAIDENRSWNEVYVLWAFLAYNAGFEIVFFNDYFFRFFTAQATRMSPLFARNPGGGLWIRKLSVVG